MKKWLMAISLTLSSLSAGGGPAWADIVVDGVVVLGEHRTAIIRENGGSREVRIGEEVGEWTIMDIQPRKVIARDRSGRVVEVTIQARGALAPPPAQPGPSVPAAAATAPATQSVPATQEETAAAPAVINVSPPPQEIAPGVYEGKPKFIRDDEVPAGYRKVRTPFGDTLVKEK